MIPEEGLDLLGSQVLLDLGEELPPLEAVGLVPLGGLAPLVEVVVLLTDRVVEAQEDLGFRGGTGVRSLARGGAPGAGAFQASRQFCPSLTSLQFARRVSLAFRYRNQPLSLSDAPSMSYLASPLRS